eukprot:CAMPEP_0174281900 /NCGR_PEP_ID=MMETSP0809-20121228/2322_1 /TAXON_ID=73025 ORGANISM="Eutreptiella gymnastica-like, Strain CCMP1594" /NCGR_SAMPLE_ID=MMETSP0809 /ASSEMBLY_ACC=CAM_ASM_000658 /LENGTH=539 /DNA_ID=CAMNT_0015375747 /DNA_START=39 /DNA_END=1658 /DNA_ORIENTATION=-
MPGLAQFCNNNRIQGGVEDGTGMYAGRYSGKGNRDYGRDYYGPDYYGGDNYRGGYHGGDYRGGGHRDYEVDGYAPPRNYKGGGGNRRSYDCDDYAPVRNHRGSGNRRDYDGDDYDRDDYTQRGNNYNRGGKRGSKSSRDRDYGRDRNYDRAPNHQDGKSNRRGGGDREREYDRGDEYNRSSKSTRGSGNERGGGKNKNRDLDRDNYDAPRGGGKNQAPEEKKGGRKADKDDNKGKKKGQDDKKGKAGKDDGQKGKGKEPPAKKEKEKGSTKASAKEKDKKKKDAKPADTKAAAKDPKAKEKEGEAATPAREGAHWKYGPFPPGSSRRAKGKVHLGGKALQKLAALDGKRKDKGAFNSSLDILANAFSFLTSAERWRLRPTGTAFALAFQLDPAWTSATLEPVGSFPEPYLKRDHLPMQMDVIHKHKDVLKSLRIQGFSGLQGALLQNFSAMEKLEIYTSRECSGLSHVPQAVKIMKLELCHLSRSADEELEALKVSHPGSEIHFIKCVDQPAVETPAAKGQPFHINAQVIAGTVHQDVL